MADALMNRVVEVTHPLVQHKLTQLRLKSTKPAMFRALVEEIGMLLGYEATRDLDLRYKDIETPLEAMRAPVVDGKKLCLVSILRAGNGLLGGMLQLMPVVPVGHIGIYRDPQTHAAVEYYFKMPGAMEERHALVLDPMLATGNSSVAAVSRLKATRPRSVTFVCLLAAPEGIATLHATHPDVPIITAAVDRCLNDKGYILPGLGDAGDRIFGTR